MSVAFAFDLIVLIVMLISAGLAFMRGFIHEVMSLLGVIGGAIAAFLFAGHFTPVFSEMLGGYTDGTDTPGLLFSFVPVTMAGKVLAYAAVFLVVVLVLKIVSHFLSKGVSAVGLGPVDRTMGVIFGLLRGIALLAVIYIPISIITSPQQKQDFFGESKTIFYVESTSKWLMQHLPLDALPQGVTPETDSAREMLQDLDVLENKDQNGSTLPALPGTAAPVDDAPQPTEALDAVPTGTAPAPENPLIIKQEAPAEIPESDRQQLENIIPQPASPVNE